MSDLKNRNASGDQIKQASSVGPQDYNPIKVTKRVRNVLIKEPF
jgi:hypothetical protein